MAALLSRFRLVLVGTRTPGNVGATARVASNFGCRDWVLADPKCRFRNWGARKYATNLAREYLEEVRVTKTVAEAVEDCQIAIGFTRRQGKNRKTSIEVGEIAALAKSGKRIALVFGNEETGLSREELASCTRTCQIPTSPEAASMNLSHATAVVLARIYAGLSGETVKSPRSAPGRAKSKTPKTAAQLGEFEGMLKHWGEFLGDIDLVRAGNPERMVFSLRKIFGRADLTPREVRALRGLLSKAQVALGVRSRGKRIAPGASSPAKMTQS